MTNRTDFPRSRVSSPSSSLWYASVALLIATGLAVSCKSIGSDAVKGIYEQRDTLAEAVRPAGAAVVEGAGRAFEDSVRPKLEGTVGSIGDTLRAKSEAIVSLLLDSLEIRALRIEDSLTVFLKRDAEAALNELISSKIAIIRDSIDGALDKWLNTLSGSLDSELKLAAGNALSHTTMQALDSLAAGLDSTGAVGQAVVALGDRVVRQAIKAIGEETEKTPWWVWAIVAVVVILVALSVGRFILALRRDKQRSETSLRLVGKAISDRDDKDLAASVKSMAQQQGVEPWLREFLDREGLLVKTESGAA